MDGPSRALAPYPVMLCSLRASCRIPNLLRSPRPCAWGYGRVGLGLQDAVPGIQEGGSGVLKGTRWCSTSYQLAPGHGGGSGLLC